MLKRRVLMAGSLSVAMTPALMARAQESRIAVVFVGHEL
jgi:hypothetical protein